MRLAVYGLLSCGLSAIVVLHAIIERQQFFPAFIQLTRSSASLMILMNLGLFLTIMLGRGLSRIFFGKLRTIEVEHLYERSWFAVTETLIAMTVFRDDFDLKFIGLFATLLLIKCGHWVVGDRVDWMEQNPNLNRLFLIRISSAMSLLFLCDVSLLWLTIAYSFKHGPSMMIVFGFEFTLLMTSVMASAIKFVIQYIDLRTDTPWENKGMYIFYLDLIVDFFKLLSYLVFFALVVHFYGLPLHIIRDLYLTLRSFIQRCKDFVQYRRATANMNERYPNATEEDLRNGDSVCIICREDMVARQPDAQPQQQQGPQGDNAVPGDTPKKLPCGHMFHFHCLRSWLERQQSCPTCRRSVLVNNHQNQNQTPNQAAQNQPAANVNANVLGQQGGPAIPGIAPVAPGIVPHAQQPHHHPYQFTFPPTAQPTQANSPTSTSTSTTTPPTSFTFTIPPPSTATPGTSTTTTPMAFQLPSSIPAIPIIPLPYPTASTSTSSQSLSTNTPFSQFTESELRAMQGPSQSAIMKRVQALQQIQNDIGVCVMKLVQVAGLSEECDANSIVKDAEATEKTSSKGKEREV